MRYLFASQKKAALISFAIIKIYLCVRAKIGITDTLF